MKQTVIKRGTKVHVLEIINEAQICKVDLGGQIGLFQLSDFMRTSENLYGLTRTPDKKKSAAAGTTEKQKM